MKVLAWIATATVMVALAACASPGTTPDPNPPKVLNNGTPVLWSSSQTTTGNAAYSPLEIYIEQSGGNLSGTNRDNIQEVDVDTSGTIDSSGAVSLTVVLTNGGSPRQTLVFTGTATGVGAGETISGTYTGTDPSESGTFSMGHN